MEESDQACVAKRLYLDDSQLLECSSKLTALSKAEDGRHGEYRVRVDQTVFHPQGGGQPADTGTIIFPEGKLFDVKFVQSHPDGDVDHFGDFAEKGVFDDVSRHKPCGTEINVTLSVDKKRRMENIRLHSAGHIMDAALKRLGYWNRVKSGKGYHFPDNPYVEYSGELTAEEMDTLPSILTAEVARIVEEAIPTNIFMEERDAAAELCGIDTSGYPHVVRIVDVAGHPCPCGGTHVKTTKELGGLDVLKCKKKKKNIRISYALVA